MKALIVWITGLYSVSLIGFLVYIRKDFLQMSGEDSLPLINLDYGAEEFEFSEQE
ncbi:MAG: hypothetical protein Kow0029_25370 [Candidatus Rifleibacteriota bacterium]